MVTGFFIRAGQVLCIPESHGFVDHATEETTQIAMRITQTVSPHERTCDTSWQRITGRDGGGAQSMARLSDQGPPKHALFNRLHVEAQWRGPERAQLRRLSAARHVA